MRKVEALIFDLDGTLVDSVEDIANALNFTLASLGCPAKSKAEVRSIVGDGVSILMKRATGCEDSLFIQEAITIFKKYYRNHCIENTRLYPGVEEVLRFFKEKKIALISNKPDEMVHQTLKHFSIQNYFSVVLGPESTKEKKPHPEPVLKVLDHLKVAPNETLIVGDGSTDMQAGKAAGILTCAVTYGYRNRKELETFKPDFFLDRIEDLKNFII